MLLRRFTCFFTLICCVGFTALTSSATTIRPPSFEQLVGHSGKVVRAEIKAVRPYEDFHEGERIVRTEVTIDVLESLTGQTPLGEMKIRHLGGSIEGLRLEVGAMPEFEVGAEVVLFLHGEGRFICPTVGWGHGKYHIDRSGADGIARVRRANGQVLQSLAQVAEPIHSHDNHGHASIAPPPISPSGMSLAAFRQSIREQVERGKEIR
ncbi:MAG: hypothetical protein SynsKO_21020 [Synoicihabitans sp.]